MYIFFLSFLFLEDSLGIHSRPKLNTFIEPEWDDRTITNPGILVSDGYPVYYPTAAVSIWKYSAPEGQYVNLLLQSFSLNKYKLLQSQSINKYEVIIPKASR